MSSGKVAPTYWVDWCTVLVHHNRGVYGHEMSAAAVLVQLR